MLAKIIVQAPTRREGLKRLKRALGEIIIEGIVTNKELHLKILEDPDFIENNYSTNFLSSKMKIK